VSAGRPPGPCRPDPRLGGDERGAAHAGAHQAAPGARGGAGAPCPISALALPRPWSLYDAAGWRDACLFPGISGCCAQSTATACESDSLKMTDSRQQVVRCEQHGLERAAATACVQAEPARGLAGSQGGCYRRVRQRPVDTLCLQHGAPPALTYVSRSSRRPRSLLFQGHPCLKRILCHMQSTSQSLEDQY